MKTEFIKHSEISVAIEHTVNIAGQEKKDTKKLIPEKPTKPLI